MTKQRGKFLTFIFSLVPGAGQMWLGFTKRGVSLMVAFILPIIADSFINIFIFSTISIVIWFVSFFDTLNLNRMEPAFFSTVKDDYITTQPQLVSFFERANFGKIAGFALIFIGVAAIWQVISFDLYHWLWAYDENVYQIIVPIVNAIPRVVIAILVIILGFRLVANKKKEDLQQDVTTTQ